MLGKKVGGQIVEKKKLMEKCWEKKVKILRGFIQEENFVVFFVLNYFFHCHVIRILRTLQVAIRLSQKSDFPGISSRGLAGVSGD